MMKIKVEANCSDAPERIFLKDLNLAFAEGDIEYIADVVTDDITWTIVGDKSVHGKAAFIEALEQMKQYKTREIFIKKVITHDKEGSTNGEMIMHDGKRFAYCDVYEFHGGSEIKSIVSYVIELA